jgi:hypothetical protein
MMRFGNSAVKRGCFETMERVRRVESAKDRLLSLVMAPLHRAS